MLEKLQHNIAEHQNITTVCLKVMKFISQLTYSGSKKFFKHHLDYDEGKSFVQYSIPVFHLISIIMQFHWSLDL